MMSGGEACPHRDAMRSGSKHQTGAGFNANASDSRLISNKEIRSVLTVTRFLSSVVPVRIGFVSACPGHLPPAAANGLESAFCSAGPTERTIPRLGKVKTDFVQCSALVRITFQWSPYRGRSQIFSCVTEDLRILLAKSRMK